LIFRKKNQKILDIETFDKDDEYHLNILDKIIINANCFFQIGFNK
jgi:hypothetical protein